MERKNNAEDNTSPGQGRAGVVDHDEPGSPSSSASGARDTQRTAVDDARQMLDEIAGLEHGYRASRPVRPDTAKTVRTILLWPVLVGWAVLKLIFMPLRKADFQLLREMAKFLRHPGHFFWFNRVAPEAAAQHFGTTSTDAMTNHARRYGAHTAILTLAVVVVLFGGFSGLATKIYSAYTDTPEAARKNDDLMIVGDSREIYASAVAANTMNFPRRAKVEIVKQGETLRSIARDRNVSIETLLYANTLEDPDYILKPGQKLVVPEVSGMLHIASPGDTVGKIANLYGTDPKVIISYKFNNLESADTSTVFKPLQEVMVPGGAKPQRTKLYMYEVRQGDTLKSVSEKFGLKADTILDNNELDNGLKVGQEIRILPADGVIYRVKRGDTLPGVANYLRTSPENIINFLPNNVARNVPLQEGQSLIVPGGSWPPPPPPVPDEPDPPPPPRPKPSNTQTANNNPAQPAPKVAPLPAQPTPRAAQPAARPQQPAAQPAPKPAAPGQAVQKPAPKPAAPEPAVQKPAPPPSNAGRATGSMVWPMRGLITTYFGQPIWYGIHIGLDISTSCGTPIVAADGGTVVQSGWDGGYGNAVLLDHGGGIKTRYGHFMSFPSVGVGQRVAKGQVIGYEGTTGASTGCHLHFEVLQNGVATDPLRWLR